MPDDALSVVSESDAVVKLSLGGSTDDSVYGKQMQASGGYVALFFPGHRRGSPDSPDDKRNSQQQEC